MKVRIDRDLCIGCGVCEALCPEVFEMDDENIAIIEVDPIPEEFKSRVTEAADSCAVDAIEIEE